MLLILCAMTVIGQVWNLAVICSPFRCFLRTCCPLLAQVGIWSQWDNYRRNWSFDRNVREDHFAWHSSLSKQNKCWQFGFLGVLELFWVLPMMWLGGGIWFRIARTSHNTCWVSIFCTLFCSFFSKEGCNHSVWFFVFSSWTYASIVIYDFCFLNSQNHEFLFQILIVSSVFKLLPMCIDG